MKSWRTLYKCLASICPTVSLYIISRSAIRGIYGITKSRMQGDIAMSAMLAILMWTISYVILTSK